jgi:hypothetical protein
VTPFHTFNIDGDRCVSATVADFPAGEGPGNRPGALIVVNRASIWRLSSQTTGKAQPPTGRGEGSFSEHHYFKVNFTLGKMLQCSANFSKIIPIRRGSPCLRFVQCSIAASTKYIRACRHVAAPLTR